VNHLLNPHQPDNLEHHPCREREPSNGMTDKEPDGIRTQCDTED